MSLCFFLDIFNDLQGFAASVMDFLNYEVSIEFLNVNFQVYQAIFGGFIGAVLIYTVVKWVVPVL